MSVNESQALCLFLVNLLLVSAALTTLIFEVIFEGMDERFHFCSRLKTCSTCSFGETLGCRGVFQKYSNHCCSIIKHYVNVS